MHKHISQQYLFTQRTLLLVSTSLFQLLYVIFREFYICALLSYVPFWKTEVVEITIP
jgi:hypothetical protein